MVLSIGSNLGDRVARLQGAVDALGQRVRAISPVYETAPWGGVDQGPFLNAVVLAQDLELDGQGWLRLAQQLEADAERIRAVKWGPRTLDVDLVTVLDGDRQVYSRTEGLSLPHPLAHLRAFVLIPWLAVQPDAALTVGDELRPVSSLLADIDAGERAGVLATDVELHGPNQQA